jgi:DNA polymerase III alpha subunit
MRTNGLNQIIVSEDDFMEVLYHESAVEHVVVADTKWVERFSHLCTLFELKTSLTWEQEQKIENDQYVKQCLSNWHLPELYADLDIENYLLSKCTTDVQRQRVILELDEFKSRDMNTVLRWLVFFVATLREHDMVWGVGRGSSVASYVLFLIGIHRVDSLEYELDIKEFLK